MPFPPCRKPRQCVLVFARAPVIGTVKTRLSAHLDADTILRLYRCMVEDTIEMLQRAGADIVVHFHPPDAQDTMHHWLGDGSIFVPQHGQTFGARMQAAFDWAFGSGYDHAVCVGTDIPDMAADIVAAAFGWLRRGICPLGPTEDGGYYLIGFAAGQVPIGVFSDDMDWGGPGIFSATVDCLSIAGIQVGPLPFLHDIDTIADLIEFSRRARHTQHRAKRTAAFADGIGVGTRSAANRAIAIE